MDWPRYRLTVSRPKKDLSKTIERTKRLLIRDLESVSSNRFWRSEWHIERPCDPEGFQSRFCGVKERRRSVESSVGATTPPRGLG